MQGDEAMPGSTGEGAALQRCFPSTRGSLCDLPYGSPMLVYDVVLNSPCSPRSVSMLLFMATEPPEVALENDALAPSRNGGSKVAT